VTEPTGEWDKMRITAKGRHVSMELNGAVIVDANLDDYKDRADKHPGLLRDKGHIGFQSHDGRVGGAAVDGEVAGLERGRLDWAL
jgi:Domain of Unknown Function (DUF1080)